MLACLTESFLYFGSSLINTEFLVSCYIHGTIFTDQNFISNRIEVYWEILTMQTTARKAILIATPHFVPTKQNNANVY